MPLERDRYRGYVFARRTCRFTMRNGSDQVHFAVSWETMNDMEPGPTVTPHERDAQFERLRDKIELMAEQKFFSMLDGDRPDEILLTTAGRGL